MNDVGDKPSRVAGTGPGADDALASLLRSAGKRPQPRPEDYERVLLASRGAWRRGLVRRRTLQYLTAAASIGILAVAWLAWTNGRDRVPVATIAAVHGPVEIETSDGVWRDVREVPGGIAAGGHVRTLAAGSAAFALANGASLRLDGATQVRLISQAHVVLDVGAVYVDSAGRGATTEIATSFGTVRDVGTQFEVRASVESLRIRVREGFVELASSGPAPGVRGTARDEITIDHAGNMRRSSVEPDSGDWDWTTSLAEPPSIDGRTVLEIVRWVAHESGKEVRFADGMAEERARSAVLSGETSDLTPLELLDVVIGTVDGLRYDLAPGVIVIGAP